MFCILFNHMWLIYSPIYNLFNLVFTDLNAIFVWILFISIFIYDKYEIVQIKFIFVCVNRYPNHIVYIFSSTEIFYDRKGSVSISGEEKQIWIWIIPISALFSAHSQYLKIVICILYSYGPNDLWSHFLGKISGPPCRPVWSICF